MAGQNGGARPGSGRKPGVSNRPKLSEYMTKEQIDDYIAQYLKMAKENPKVMVHVIDNLIGKAPQSLDIRGEILSKFIKLDE